MDSVDHSNPIVVKPSLLQGAAGLLASAAAFAMWWQTGRISDMVGALGFLVIAPAWYASPLQFSAPLKQVFSIRNRRVPKWALISAGVGGFLIAASVVMRLWHDL